VALKILLADDSMTAQKMGQKILAEAGYDVIAVSNGAAAVKKIASEKPDLAVLDIYMPGYTGLEVCERVRSAQETAKIPVLLTVGKMEIGSFKPEDANRVKADGVIIKPFEASDLLAAVKKIEEKLAAAPPPEPAYEKTMKLNVAEMFKQDSSYQEWQVAAPEHKDEEPEDVGSKVAKLVVPKEDAGSAVFGDMLEDAGPEAKAASLESVPAPETPKQYATAPSVAVEPVAPPIQLDTAPNTQKYEAPPSAAPHRDSDLEPTSGWGKHHDEPVVHAQDPALVTDPTEMSSAFVTKFGVDNPEPIVVGDASAAGIDGLYTPAEGAEEPATADVAASVAKLSATDEEAASVEVVEEGAPESVPSAAEEDDFEKRVAAAMTTLEEPASRAAEEPVPAPVVEAVAAPAPEPELAPTVMSQAPVIAAAPAPEPVPMAAAAAAAAAPSAPAWTAQEAAVEAHEATTSLDQEMLKAFNASLPEAEPHPPEPEPPAPVVETVAAPPAELAAAAPADTPDVELAKALASAVSPDAGPMTVKFAAAQAAAASGGTIDPARLAEAIHRALDQLKPDLIAKIAKELEQK
jgi:CheY-like chemotaxis protein